MISLGIDILAVQETRYSKQLSDISKFHICSLPAVKGNGGIAILVTKSNGTKLRSEQAVGNRILVVRLLFHQKRITVIGLHASPRGHPKPVHDKFSLQLLTAMRNIPSSEE
eukprot:6471687-Amphidinium_carterae.1